MPHGVHSIIFSFSECLPQAMSITLAIQNEFDGSVILEPVILASDIASRAH